MQWQNLIPLIDNALAGQDDYGERNFDDCGDPKQSIYRWRGGKASSLSNSVKTIIPSLILIRN
jgi:ATP-dependent exoDNAse (exonuclease V) beta subunit